MPKYFGAQIKNGELVLDDKKEFRRSVRHSKEGTYLVALYRRDAKTVREFQALYFATLGEWSPDTGWTKDELHDLIKAELFPQVTDKASTQDLDTTEWHALLMELENFLILKFENI